jgi:hypothetical protein
LLRILVLKGAQRLVLKSQQTSITTDLSAAQVALKPEAFVSRPKVGVDLKAP